MPVEGGEEIEVVEGPLVTFKDWTLSRFGIYYATARQGPGVTRSCTIHFLDFESGQATDVIRRDGARILKSLAVSPDEDWVLYVEVLPPDRDLVLVDGFR